METQGLTHIDAATGNAAMVDVSEKKVTKRIAKEQSIIVLEQEFMQHL